MKENNYLSLTFAGVMLVLAFFNRGYPEAEKISRQKASVLNLAAETASPREDLSIILSLDPVLNSNPNFNIQTFRESILSQALSQAETDSGKKNQETIPEKAVPDITSKEALVYDLTSRQEIFSFNTASSWPLASITKLMTAVIAVEKIGYDTPVKITAEAVKTEEASGNFQPEETFAVRDLIFSMFLVSSNDAAETLAENYGGGREMFISEMNNKAAALGMEKTKYMEPVGLRPENVSSATDLEKLVSYIYANHPELFYFSRQTEAEIKDLSFGDVKKYKNINEFAGQPNFIGGKTGYTDEAKGNLVSLFSKNGHAVLIVVMGTEDRFLDTQNLLDWTEI